MSILKDKLRGVLFSNLRPDMPLRVRKACADLFDAVDSDLDIAGYYPSSTTEESAERFDSAIVLEADDSLPPDMDLTIEDDDEIEPDIDPLNLELDESELE